MDHTLALLLPLLQLLSVGTAAPLQLLSVGTAAPLPAEMVRMKSKIKWMAEQLVVRLDKNFQLPPDLTLSPAAIDIDGPASVVSILEGYNSLISDSIAGVGQIKRDILSLSGYLDQWRQRHCREQRPKPPMPEPLQDLHSRKHFVHTVTYEVVMRLKEFLNLLLKNLDQELLKGSWQDHCLQS